MEMMAISLEAAYERAHAMYRVRRNRDEASGDLCNLFGEPGWDIMLDLFIARRRGEKVKVSSICLDAGVASTTVLRWLDRLDSEKLIVRSSDPTDARRRLVALTDKGEEFMVSVMSALGPIVSA